jgi:hypothetical protein
MRYNVLMLFWYQRCYLWRICWSTAVSNVRGCIQKFPDWPPGARELQMLQLSAIRCSYIAILWVSLVSFALCVASQRVFIGAVVYFVIDSVLKLLDTPSCSAIKFWNIYEGAFVDKDEIFGRTSGFLRNDDADTGVGASIVLACVAPCHCPVFPKLRTTRGEIQGNVTSVPQYRKQFWKMISRTVSTLDIDAGMRV